MAWTRLVDLADDCVWRGAVFRCRGQDPYEDVVDFLLVADPASPSGFTLVVATGYKAGHRRLVLPQEALATTPSAHAISAQWLRANWRRQVYELGPDDVFVLANYEAPDSHPADT